jgi:hypothetical protein
MEFIGILKRVGPFILTFVAGLIIASFFVSVTAPNFNWNSKRSQYKFSKMRHIKHENRQLRNENLRLKMEIEQLKQLTLKDGAVTDPAFDVEAPQPPPPPKYRQMPMKTKTVEAN